MLRWVCVLVLMLGSFTVFGQETGDPVVNRVLQSTITMPSTWEVLENIADIRLRSDNNSDFTLSNAAPVVLNDSRALNSIDQAAMLFAERGEGAFVNQRVISTSIPFALLEYSRDGNGSADSALLVAPWDTRHYSVGILESSSPQQYTSDLSAVIDIFTSRELATSAELVEELVPETLLLTSSELPTMLSGGEYTLRLPDGYQNDTELAAVTGLLTFGFGSTSSLGLDFYGFDGQLFNAAAPTVIIAPGTATQLLTTIGVETRPRAANVDGRYALITEGVTSIGNYMNVAVRQDSGSFWSVLVVMNATTPLNDTIREFGYSVAATLEANSASDLLAGQSATLDVITGIDIPQITLSPGAPQIVAVVGQPQIGMTEAGLEVLVVYGDMEGDASSLTIALVSSDNPRTPQGDSVAISSDPARQQRGLAAQDLTWFCDFRTYDALYIMALEDDQGNRSVIAEVNIVCGGSSPSLTMLSGTLSTNAGGDLADDLNLSADTGRLRLDQQATWDEMGATFFLPPGWSVVDSDGEYLSVQSGDRFMTIYPIDVFPGDSYRTTAFAETSNRTRSSMNETGEMTERTLPELDYTYYRTDFSDLDDDFDGVLIVFAYQDDYYAIYATQSPLTGERTALGAAAEAVMASLVTGQVVTAVYPPFGQGVIGDALDGEAAALAAELGMLGEIITDVPETLIVFDTPPALAEPSAGAAVQPSTTVVTPSGFTSYTSTLSNVTLDVPTGFTVNENADGTIITLDNMPGERIINAPGRVQIGIFDDGWMVGTMEPDVALHIGTFTMRTQDPEVEEFLTVVNGWLAKGFLYEEDYSAGAYIAVNLNGSLWSIQINAASMEELHANAPGIIQMIQSVRGEGSGEVALMGVTGTEALAIALETQIALYRGASRVEGLPALEDVFPSVVALDSAAPSQPDEFPADAINITYGSAVQGRLQSGGDVRYTFSGSIGDNVTIAMNSPAFDTYLELYDASGRLIAENDDYNGLNSQIDFNLPSSGTYVIVARGFDPQASGSFILSLEGL